MIKIVVGVEEMHSLANRLNSEGKSIGFVPTMGFLHDGHVSLIRASKKKTDITVVSIFVNPTQFAPNEDYNSYPRNFEKDESLLQKEEVDFLFFPETKEIYNESFQAYIEVTELTKRIEGEFRPTHFKGVTTIVAILFNCVKPRYAFFGQKDAQQAAAIKRMVTDLKYDLEIIVCPIIREPDGLAMSSRNVYLSSEDRTRSLLLNSSLKEAEHLILSGEMEVKKIIKKINNNFLKEASIHLNYIRIVNSESFQEVDLLEKGKSFYILIAAKIGSTRLIDNIIVSL